jgi:DNA repair exonuclease SbcCD ATPase subunit
MDPIIGQVIMNNKLNIVQNDSSSLTLTTIPSKEDDIKKYYHSTQVESYYTDFEKTIHIVSTIEDLLQAVDLIALAYQTSFDNGLKCAPILATIKTNYLSLVSDSSTTMLRFKSKSQNAIFKLAMVSKYFTMLNEAIKNDSLSIDIHTIEEFEKSVKDILEDINEVDDSESNDGQEELEEYLDSLNSINKELNLEEASIPKPLKLFKFKKVKRAIDNKFESLRKQTEESNDKKLNLFSTSLKEIGECSIYAKDMEKDTDELISKVSTLKDKADQAFKSCVEQDVDEKQKKKELEQKSRDAKEKQAELKTRQNGLDEQIEEARQLEKKLEKKLEAAVSRAFWGGILKNVTEIASSAFNIYSQSKTGGTDKINTSIKELNSELDKLKTEKDQKEKDQKNAKEKFDKLNKKAEQLKKDVDNLKEKEEESKAKIDKKDLSDKELESAKKKLKQSESDIKTIKDNIKTNKKDLAEAKEKLDRDLTAMKVASASFDSLSKSMSDFQEQSQSEIKNLSEKEDKIYDQRIALQKDKLKTVSDLARIVEELKNAVESGKELDQLISALRLTSETIERIIVAFERIKRFWAGIKVRCNDLIEKSDNVTNSLKTSQDLDLNNFETMFNDLISDGFFDLVYSWIALERLNDFALTQIENVLKTLEKSFTNKSDLNILYANITKALDDERERLELPLKNQKEELPLDLKQYRLISGVLIDAPDTEHPTDATGTKAKPGSLTIVEQGVNFKAVCKKCNKDNVVNIGEWDGTYTRMIRKRKCKKKGCGGDINHLNMQHMYFKDCKYTFSGIKKATDEEFTKTQTHKRTEDSWWHKYDRELFIQYSELEVKVSFV